MPAIGIAGMERAMRANLVAKSGKAVEIAGSIDTLLLDKTGTITLGDRRATEFAPCQQVPRDKVRDAAFLTSLEDPTPEGRSIVALATEQGVDVKLSEEADGATFEAFSAETRLSGVDLTSGKKNT
ncbi:hypothetical protein HORIV_41450 [Vreelandella olivaria]|uniref:Uncharacterized protein n=1 Tax=Vreelandella olivaria TaxID=390919 RepID=A0ABN5WXP1_9GAMM|nr:hypothetical protein HORIV_41450 [Halomonas olivaria]